MFTILKHLPYQSSLLENIRIHHECEGGIDKSVPRITIWHHYACQVMPNGDPEGQTVITNDRFLHAILTQIMDSLSCSLLNTAFSCLKRLPEISEYPEMRHDMMMSLQHNNDVT